MPGALPRGLDHLTHEDSAVQNCTDFITTAAELRAAVDQARRAGAPPRAHLELGRPVRWNWHVDQADGELPATYPTADLRLIDLSDFRVSGDFRGANLAGAVCQHALLDSADFGPIEVWENCPPARDRADL